MTTTIEKANDETLAGLEQELEEKGLLPEATEDESTETTADVDDTPESTEQVDEENETSSDEATEETEETEEVKPVESPEWVSKYVDEFEETGDLSKDSIETLKTEYKIPEALINNYVQLAKQNRDFASQASEAKFSSDIFNAAGGKEEYDRLIKFAGESLSEGEVEAYNKALDTKDVEKVSLYLENFKLKSGAPVTPTKTNTKIGGNASGSSGSTIKPFKSQAEFQEAASDRRYNRDAAYTKEVEQRLAKSTW